MKKTIFVIMAFLLLASCSKEESSTGTLQLKYPESNYYSGSLMPEIITLYSLEYPDITLREFYLERGRSEKLPLSTGSYQLKKYLQDDDGNIEEVIFTFQILGGRTTKIYTYRSYLGSDWPKSPQ